MYWPMLATEDCPACCRYGCAACMPKALVLCAANCAPCCRPGVAADIALRSPACEKYGCEVARPPGAAIAP